MNENKDPKPDFAEILRQQELLKTGNIAPQQPMTQIPEFVPFMIAMNTPEQLAACFDGPVANIGDVVELFCYGMVGNSRMFKWRVVKKGNENE